VKGQLSSTTSAIAHELKEILYLDYNKNKEIVILTLGIVENL
jgi:hypothetical protein